MPSYNLFCDPAIGQTLRSDGGPLHDYGTIFGNCSAILGGIPSASPTNVNCSDLSVIVMGDTNVINTFGSPASNGCFNFIGNGLNQLVAGENNFVGGGGANVINTFASGVYVFASVIAGGFDNLICDNGSTAASFSSISGGSGDQVFGVYSSVVGGRSNVVHGCNSFIGGGDSNKILQPFYTMNSVVGGCENTIGGATPTISPTTFSFIGGGAGNCIDGATNGTCAGVIGGGARNMICDGSPFSAIFGGCNSKVSGVSSFIGGGDTNVINSTLGTVDCAFIGGGVGNTICDDGTATANLSFIGGGNTNTVFGLAASIVGGSGNNAKGDNSFIGGGSNHNVFGGSSFVGGGANHCIDGLNSFVGGGISNCICNSSLVFPGVINCATIAGGEGNCIDFGGPGAVSDYAFIGGGFQNWLGGGRASVIAGGELNKIAPEYGVISGGYNNQAYGCYSTVGGGCQNLASGNFSVVAGGGGVLAVVSNNAAGHSSFVGAGFANLTFQSCGCAAFVGGGGENVVNGDFSFIGGGCGNQVACCGTLGLGATFSFIGGGGGNCINSSATVGTVYAIIGGGQKNTICGGAYHASIFGGFNNVSGAACSFIGGGEAHLIDSPPGAPSTYGVIGGGQLNAVCKGTNHSGVFSGNKNCVNGSCSAILGGSGNSDGGFNNVFIAGSGITGVSANTMHVNGLWANGLPGPGYVGGITNTVYFDTVPSLPAPYNACKFLMIA